MIKIFFRWSPSQGWLYNLYEEGPADQSDDDSTARATAAGKVQELCPEVDPHDLDLPRKASAQIIGRIHETWPGAEVEFGPVPGR